MAKHSKNLLINVRLDTGQYDFISNGSELGFFRSGLTTAGFCHAGKVTVLNEQLIMAAMTGDSTSENCLISLVGAGSTAVHTACTLHGVMMQQRH